jgi:hypothetical protein
MGFEVHDTEPASVCKEWKWTASQGVRDENAGCLRAPLLLCAVSNSVLACCRCGARWCSRSGSKKKSSLSCLGAAGA